MAAIITAENRKAGTGDAERAALHKSVISHSGKYRVEGKEFVTAVDMSWNETWNGTEQRRNWRIEDGKLFIDTAPIPAPNFPGKMVVARLIWERDQ
jgi:Lipocalin-like domain